MLNDQGEPFKLSFKNASVLPFDYIEKDYAYLNLKYNVEQPQSFMENVFDCYFNIKQHAQHSWFGYEDDVEYSKPWDEQNGSLALKWPSKYVGGKAQLEMLEKLTKKEKHTKKERTQISLETFSKMSLSNNLSISGTFTVKPWVRKTEGKYKFGVTFVLDKSFI